MEGVRGPLDLARRAGRRSAPPRPAPDQLGAAPRRRARGGRPDGRRATTLRYTYVPQSIPGSRPAVLEFVESIGEQHAFVEASRWQILLATARDPRSPAALAVYAARRAGTSAGRSSACATGCARSPTATSRRPLALVQQDEIGDLARRDRRDVDAARRRAPARSPPRPRRACTALEQLRHTDRLTTIGQLAAGVAHELGTPLAVIAGRAEMIATGEASGERATASARVIVEQATR